MRLTCLLPIIVAVLFFPMSPAFAQEAETPTEETPIIDILPTDAIALGEKVENGITAYAWLYRAPTAESPETVESRFPYLLFVRFLSVDSNIRIDKGLVAYKLENMSEEKTPAVKMDFRDGYFVSGLDKPRKGLHILHVGCKLEDEKKRQFQYELLIK